MTARRPITIEDLAALKLVGDPQISPDGALLAFVQKVADGKDYRSAIWTVPSAGGTPAPFTAGAASEHSPRWSPDGQTLAFLSNRSGASQIWLIGRSGGEARQLTTMRHGVGGLTWAPDSRCIAFTSKADPNEADESLVREKTRDEKDAEEQQRKDNLTVRHVTRLKYKTDEGGMLDGKYSHIWLIDIPAAGAEAAAPRRITGGPHDDGGLAFSPDGAAIAFSSQRAQPDADMSWASDVFVVPAAGGELIQLTHMQGPAGNITWSPDGKLISFWGHNYEYLNATQTKVYVVPAPAGGKPAGEPRCITADFDQKVGDAGINDLRSHPTVAGSAWSPDGATLYFHSSWHGSTNLYRAPVGGGAVEQVTHGDWQIFQYSFCPATGVFAVAALDPLSPGDIYTIDLNGEVRQLTNANAELLAGIELVTPVEHWFKGAEGWDLQGWFMPPVGAEPGKQYPLVLEVHGGPHAMYSFSFFHEFQLLCANGYAVFFCNPRGSDGYGQDFVHAVVHHYGERDYEDIMAAADYAAQLPGVDATRLGITGGSYGGFMTNWVVGHTARFKAAVTDRCISNWTSFAGVSDIGPRFTLNEVGGDPWANTDLLWDKSPLKYAPHVTTPLLIQHSELDFRCPIEQGEQMFTALKRMGKTAEFVRYPNSNHDLSRGGKPPLRAERLHHLLRWFNEYL